MIPMANEEHLELLKQGTTKWNTWRSVSNCLVPDLNRADLFGIDLRGANLNNASCISANFISANLQGANCQGAEFSGALLIGHTKKIHWSKFTIYGPPRLDYAAFNVRTALD